jgi:hypothetical protein
MASCTVQVHHPAAVQASALLSVFVKTEEDKQAVDDLLAKTHVRPHMKHNPTMFPRDAE